ncbi:hypothetical protein [Gloeocapsa sp. PCC 73106]|uniref:hypothetical protein n=1 Tax=Gloeocapsa sp. PCC 73106 TaxID=102232 RepID=UPI0002AC8296|nr:hypothetical protein [Gloeocapsa sp. PCC 73106]ELR99492.1 hypothetical protein GLO73106DRAFT_00033440 [Gloeocapsa sp. PCC 73106]
MTIQQVLLFMGQTAQNLDLQQEIKQLLGTGDGNISDGAELDSQEIAVLKGEKAQDIAKLAQTKGLNFVPEELIKVIEAFEKNKQETALFDSLGLVDITSSSTPQPEIIELTYRSQVYQKVIPEIPATAAQINPKKEVVQFMYKSSEDAHWQEQIRTILGIGDGNISSAAELDEAEAKALQGPAGAKVAEFAHKHRFYFSQADLIEVVEMFQACRQGRLSQAQLLRNLGVSTGALTLLSTQKVVKLMFKGGVYEKIVGPTVASTVNPKITVIKFLEQSGESEARQQELEKILGVGDGNISSSEELDQQEVEAIKGDRGAQLTALANRYGFNFTQQDLIDVVQAFERYRNGEITQVDLDSILGLPPGSVSKPTQNLQEYIYRSQRYRKVDGIMIPIDDPKLDSTTSNPKTQVIDFMEETAEDKQLRTELQQLLGVGDGDISSVATLEPQEAEALKSSKSALVTDLARQKGFQFSPEDLIQVISAFQRHQAGELSEEQLFESLGVSRSKKGFFDKVVDLLNRNVWDW